MQGGLLTLMFTSSQIMIVCYFCPGVTGTTGRHRTGGPSGKAGQHLLFLIIYILLWPSHFLLWYVCTKAAAFTTFIFNPAATYLCRKIPVWTFGKPPVSPLLLLLFIQKNPLMTGSPVYPVTMTEKCLQPCLPRKHGWQLITFIESLCVSPCKDLQAVFTQVNRSLGGPHVMHVSSSKKGIPIEFVIYV